jgi:4-amino-4-deoxy-L-arabinose transferase-like glycosyltransferase
MYRQEVLWTPRSKMNMNWLKRSDDHASYQPESTMNRSYRWVCAWVFAASAFTILVFWKLVPPSYLATESGDYTAYYEPVARNLVNNHSFVLPDATLAIRYPPGFPSLLAFAFAVSSLTAIPEAAVLSMLILLAMGSSSVLIYMFAKSVWGPVPGLIAALAWISNPFALWLTKQPNSEVPFLVMFYTAIYLFWRNLLTKNVAWYDYLWSGVLLGVTSLIRPIAIGAVFILSAALLLLATHMKIRSRLLLIGVMLAGNVAAVLPWQLWVYHETGKIIILSTGGLPSIREGLTYAVDLDGYRVTSKIPEDVLALMQDVNSRSTASFGEILSVLIQQIEERPQALAKLLTMKAARSWYGTDSGRYESGIMLLQSLFLLSVLWCSVVCWRQGGVAKNLAIVVWALVFYFWAMTILVFSIVRYMVPALGLLTVMIPAFFSRAVDSKERRAGWRWRSFFASVAGVSTDHQVIKKAAGN